MFCRAQNKAEELLGASLVQTLPPGPAHCDLRGRGQSQPSAFLGTQGSSPRTQSHVCSCQRSSQPNASQPCGGRSGKGQTTPQSLL